MPELVDAGTNPVAALPRLPVAPDGGSLFIGCAVIGAVLWLVLMIFVPGLRSGGAFILFTSAIAVVFTALAIIGKASAERKFLEDLTSTVNDVIEGLTGNMAHRLSAQQFRALIENGEPLPLLVHGVPGWSSRQSGINSLCRCGIPW